jgi:subtilisin family serine protease
VIAVGATNHDDLITSFSNTGSYLEVAAPGYRVYSTWKYGKYRSMSGTSMSCPHVAGLVALIIAEYGKLPVGDFNDKGMNTIRGILHHTALDLGTEGWDPAFGYGLAMASWLF